ncbi:MAG: hypothetical protein OXH59_15955, partial [Rhodospirillaceae bacterium]|nr:hypothetical protein [Rhodospirillaceae bacterium]
MDELDLKGAFWLEGKADEPVMGHLTFNSKEWPTLELFGSLREDGEMSRDGESIRIHGLAGGKTLTLEGCSDAGTQLEMPGIRRERYHVWVILSGAHLSAQQLTQFTRVRCQLRDLERWVGRTGTDIKQPAGFPRESSGPITISHTLLDKLVGSSERGEVEVSFPITLNRDPFEARLRQRCSLAIEFAEPVSLEDALGPCPELQDLVSIGIDSPTVITEVSLSYSDSADAGPGGEVVDGTVKAYGRWRGDDTSRKAARAHPAMMLFTFDGIGDTAGIGRWLDTSAKYRAAIGPLMSHVYSPDTYADDKFLQIVIGAEALGRIR